MQGACWHQLSMHQPWSHIHLLHNSNTVTQRFEKEHGVASTIPGASLQQIAGTLPNTPAHRSRMCGERALAKWGGLGELKG